MDTQKALQWAVERLRTSDSPNLDAEVLLSFTLKKPKEFLFAHPERKITKRQEIRYKQLINRRRRGEPVAYLIGHKEFYGLDFLVSPAVLIPRPETELIIDALKQTLTISPPSGRIKGGQTIKQFNNLTIIDVGTGSGCLSVTAAKVLLKLRHSERSEESLKIYATDLSPAALKIARLNAQRHGVARRIKFLRGNLLEPFIKTLKHKNIKTIEQLNNSTIVILANLPYLTTAQWRQTAPDIKKYEPRLALDAGPDGLKYFRELFSQIKKNNIQHLISNILLEIDPAQTKSVKSLIRNCLPSASLQIKKDLSGRERLVIVNLKKTRKTPPRHNVGEEFYSLFASFKNYNAWQSA